MMLIPGLSERDEGEILQVFQSFPDILCVRLFGSRAKNTFKPGSDVDLALEGPELSFDTVRRASYLLNEETYLPYQFDLLDYNCVNTAMKEHISRVGKVIYARSGTC